MNELEIKALLQTRLAASHQGQGAVFVSELFIDAFSRRADLVMANGQLSAFEIKSDKDTLERLSGQLETYLRLFEQVTVVCAERHQAGVEERAPDVVGVWVLTADGRLKISRKAKTQKQNLHQSWLSFLPVDELRDLLVQHGLTRSGTRDALLSRALSINIKNVRRFVLDYFKMRREERIAKIKATKTAQSQALRLSTVPLRDIQQTTSENLRAIPRLIS